MNKYEDNFWAVLWQFLPGIVKSFSVIVIIAGVFSFVNLSNTAGATKPQSAVFAIPLQKSYNTTLGNMESNVKIVYFVDYQCPACKGNNPTMQSIKKDYATKVGFIYKHFPLESRHPYAKNAAKAVQAAGIQGKFFEFGDKVFDNQEKGLSNSTMENIAKELNLNLNKFNDERSSTLLDDQVKADLSDLQQTELPKNSKGDSKAAGVVDTIGTPTTILYKDNQIKDWWTGGLAEDVFKARLDEALK
jgi:protein-disulfide isomerase